MAKRSSEEFQKVSEVLCESPLDPPCVHPFFLNLLDSFSFALLSFDAVSLCFLFSLSSMITLGLPLLHFGSRTNFAICAVCRLLDSCSLKPHPSCSQLYQAFIPPPPPHTHPHTHFFYHSTPQVVRSIHRLSYLDINSNMVTTVYYLYTL